MLTVNDVMKTEKSFPKIKEGPKKLLPLLSSDITDAGLILLESIFTWNMYEWHRLYEKLTSAH